jgi:hypothetical protein
LSRADEIRDLIYRSARDAEPPQQVAICGSLPTVTLMVPKSSAVNRGNLNGQPAVKVSVQKQPDANTVQVVDAVKRQTGGPQMEPGRTDSGGSWLSMTATLDESRLYSQFDSATSPSPG